jgi:hypothetical protein
MTIFRRLRGVIGTAVTWALGWAGVGIVHGSILFLWSRRDGRLPNITWFDFVSNQMQLLGMLGAATGSVFALGLWLGERGNTATKLTVGRAAAWGVLAAAAYPAVLAWKLDLGMPGFVQQFGVPTLMGMGLGAASAALMVTLARRGEPPGGVLNTDAASALLDGSSIAFGSNLGGRPELRHDQGADRPASRR